jgi:hypothetical protein
VRAVVCQNAELDVVERPEQGPPAHREQSRQYGRLRRKLARVGRTRLQPL